MRDWRGVEITEGATVVYGAPVSRSISPTVAVVRELRPKEKSKAYHPEDRVSLEVMEYAYGYRSDVTKRVSVMAERVTVIAALDQSTTVCPGCRESYGSKGTCRRCEMAAEREAEKAEVLGR